MKQTGLGCRPRRTSSCSTTRIGASLTRCRVPEQRLLFSELAPHLTSMALFKVNTGLREQEVVTLRWQWECQIPAHVKVL
jgi:hypothetical protein